MKALTILVASLVIASSAVFARSASAAEPAFWSWAATPPMGWNSWDCYGPTVVEAEVKANADYMAKHLKSHGWEYVVVDIRWYVENDKAQGYNEKDPRFTMDENGRFWPAVNRFPSAADKQGFKPLADYVHGLGLKFGIHLMRGIPVKAVNENTPILGSTAHAADIATKEGQCKWLHDMYGVVAEREGAQEYYNSVINLYASWGVDYLKIDDLSAPSYHQGEIELIRRAIDGCGRPIVLSMSPGPTPIASGEHASQHANLWRLSDDFWDRWDGLKPQFAHCREWAPFAGPGHWPDADMLPLGKIGLRAERGKPRMSGFTRDEQRTLMSLWCIVRSPLMFGGDLPSNDEWTTSLITNDEALAVNQRSTGGRELYHRDGHVAWVAEAADSPTGDKYVALFNTADAPKGGNAEVARGVSVEVSLADVGFAGPCTVRDLWERKDLGEFTDEFAAEIPFHGGGLYRIRPASGK